MYTVYDFEHHCGRKACRKWRESIRVVNGSNISVSQWIEDRCNAADADLPEESSRVSVYWPADDEWYHGEVKDVDDFGRSHVKYDDGQVEILNFAVERYKLAEPTCNAEIADEDSKEAMLSLPAVIDLCSSSDDLDDPSDLLLLTAGTLTQHTSQSGDVKAGTVANDRQQQKTGQPPSAGRTSVAKKRYRKSKDCGEDQHENQRQHSRKNLTPVKAHRRSSKQDAAQAAVNQ
ncbi:TPA: DNA mismatch repair protein msh6 [Trebouxia sp. C0004]